MSQNNQYEGSAQLLQVPSNQSGDMYVDLSNLLYAGSCTAYATFQVIQECTTNSIALGTNYGLANES